MYKRMQNQYKDVCSYDKLTDHFTVISFQKVV